MTIVRSSTTVRRFAAENPACWCCGSSARLATHHIIGGAGRSDERCNLSRLCLVCHERAEGQPFGISVGGGPTVRLGPLTLANVLWLKMKRDPEHYDRGRLADLAHRKVLPRACRPREFQEVARA